MEDRAGTRRDTRPLAALLTVEDIYPRAFVNPTPQVVLSQDISLRLPPYGRRGSGVLVVNAVAARFSGWSFRTTRREGFWLMDLFTNNALNFQLLPVAPVGFVQQTAENEQSYSYDFGMSDWRQDGVFIDGGDFAASIPSDFCGVGGGVQMSLRTHMPLWVPPDVWLQCNGAVNTGQQIQVTICTGF